MTAKEYLQQAVHLNLLIHSKLEQVQMLDDLATKAGAVLSLTPPSGTRSVHGMEGIVTKMVDIKGEINDALNKLLELMREITAAVNKVQSFEQRVLLEQRYLCCKTWEDIAYGMNYSVRSVYKIHGAALKSFETVLDKK